MEKMLDSVCPRLVILNLAVFEMLPPLPHSCQVSQGLEGVSHQSRKGVLLKVSWSGNPHGQKKALMWVCETAHRRLLVLALTQHLLN